MPSQHKHPAISFRPPREVRARLKAYAERTGQALNAVISRAVTEYLDKHDPDPSKEQER